MERLGWDEDVGDDPEEGWRVEGWDAAAEGVAGDDAAEGRAGDAGAAEVFEGGEADQDLREAVVGEGQQVTRRGGHLALRRARG